MDRRLDSLEKNLLDLITKQATRVRDNQNARFNEFYTYFVALFPKVNHIVDTVNSLDVKVNALDALITVLDEVGLGLVEIKTSLNAFSEACFSYSRCLPSILRSFR